MRLNAIDELLREFAPISEDDAMERVADEVARRRLRRAIADERRPRTRWRFLLPGAVAGGLAALILAITALLPGHESSAPEPASPATVLEHAACVATRRVPAAYPGPHQYLYLKFREGWTQAAAAAGSAPFAYQTTDTQQDWVAPNGSGRQRYIADGPARFFARRDRAAWLAAGCPTLTIPPTDGTYPAGGYPAGNQLDSSGLPAEPRALLAAIVKRFEGGKLHVAQTFEIVGTLLQDSGSPVLRAALYRMVAHSPACVCWRPSRCTRSARRGRGCECRRGRGWGAGRAAIRSGELRRPAVGPGAGAPGHRDGAAGCQDVACSGRRRSALLRVSRSRSGQLDRAVARRREGSVPCGVR